MTVAECRDVAVTYGAVTALGHVSLTVCKRDRIALVGRSGSGKSTLLHVLAGLLPPTQGTYESHGRSAVVFQGANLLPTFTAFENVAFAEWAAERVPEPFPLLQLVGLGDKAEHLPAELSGGEAQRVAIARALAQQPDMLLCDEPTGHLDSDTAERVLDLIDALQDEFGFALVVATHDAEVAARFERVVELEDGAVR